MNDKDTVVVPPRARIAELLADEVRDYRAAQDAAATERDKLYRMGQKDALILVGPLIDEVLAAAPSTSVREEVSALVTRLRAYRPVDEWGEGVRHTICDEAADALEVLAALKPSTDKGGEE